MIWVNKMANVITLFFTADISACDSRKSTGLTDNIEMTAFPWGGLVSYRLLYKGLHTWLLYPRPHIYTKQPYTITFTECRSPINPKLCRLLQVMFMCIALTGSHSSKLSLENHRLPASEEPVQLSLSDSRISFNAHTYQQPYKQKGSGRMTTELSGRRGVKSESSSAKSWSEKVRKERGRLNVLWCEHDVIIGEGHEGHGRRNVGYWG